MDFLCYGNLVVFLKRPSNASVLSDSGKKAVFWGGCLCVVFWCWVLSVFGCCGGNAGLGSGSLGCRFLVAPGFFVEQNRILWVTLPIKLGIPDTPEVLVLSIAPDR